MFNPTDDPTGKQRKQDLINKKKSFKKTGGVRARAETYGERDPTSLLIQNELESPSELN